MTLGAADRQAQERAADDLERVGHHRIGGQGLVDATGRRAIHSHPKKSGRRQRLDLLGRQVHPRLRHQLVAGHLLDDKPIEGLVGIE